jgi:tRNA (guanine37-N1)-methyltransferase
MVGIKVKREHAEKVKRFLLQNGVFDPEYLPQKWGEFLVFPIIKGKEAIVKKRFPSVDVVMMRLEKAPRKPTVKELLQNVLTKKELSLVPRTYEQVGDIVIIELPDTLIQKERHIGRAFLETLHHAKTVVRKLDIHSGIYRPRKVKFLAGELRK